MIVTVIHIDGVLFFLVEIFQDLLQPDLGFGFGFGFHVV